ncbi:hypothetical protein LZ575_18790 [Antarcticibacterium sp. 1MA-6-2]|uniref:hypothetical protein n=1 Tax=Antarcticibacterium sp. 1MA-6-2 TaxID=2908210 RepID=UPI001F222AF4|nr:hypothetical protein [Antarcticibacterium sp. 1MA-6-2]UJH90778.1 hypothetical protein LZ575_18790 [Antarcticibacterium sp. 1MA-6-2]
MTAYILQVVFFQLLFLLVYEVLLKKETFFTYNRWYLLTTSVLALLLPFLKIEALAYIVPAEAMAGNYLIWLPEVFIGDALSSGSKSFYY